eukprot:TRINITY_DN35541_c0_g1_i1.p1 TRINITY_DN35541_c0_g1~~TRINITY_DN35541_c0_g1_i1.p1  ORF type:complete len:329 (+),score=74.70 TRINITY_DN35541_c0_g1_i1:63-989(+)
MPIINEDPLHKYDPKNFGFVKDEVQDAMQFDWKRDKVDDAKKRAITTAGTYGEFKDRVAGCTLKPIHRAEFNAPPKYAFNRQVANVGVGGGPLRTYASGYEKQASAPRSLAGGSSGSQGPRLPKTPQEFDRELRRCKNPEESVDLLERIGGEGIGRLFSREIDPEVLRKLFVILEEARIPGAARRFLLELATRCPSSATVASSFFGPEERQMVVRLLAWDRASDQREDVRICAALGVQPSAVAAAISANPDDRAPEAARSDEACRPEESDERSTGVATADAGSVRKPGDAAAADQPDSGDVGLCDEMD